MEKGRGDEAEQLHLLLPEGGEELKQRFFLLRLLLRQNQPEKDLFQGLQKAKDSVHDRLRPLFLFLELFFFEEPMHERMEDHQRLLVREEDLHEELLVLLHQQNLKEVQLEAQLPT